MLNLFTHRLNFDNAYQILYISPFSFRAVKAQRQYSLHQLMPYCECEAHVLFIYSYSKLTVFIVHTAKVLMLNNLHLYSTSFFIFFSHLVLQLQIWYSLIFHKTLCSQSEHKETRFICCTDKHLISWINFWQMTKSCCDFSPVSKNKAVHNE